VAQHSFELDGLLFGVRTNSRAFAQWLAEAMPATLVLDEEAQPNYSVWISNDDTKMGKRFHLVYKDSTLLMRTFDVAEAVRSLLADVEALTYGHRRDALYIQSTFLSLKGVDALFPEELLSMFDGIRRRIRPLGLRLPTTRFVAIDLETGEMLPRPNPLLIDTAALDGLTRKVTSEPTAWPRAPLDRRATIDLVCTFPSPGNEPADPVSSPGNEPSIPVSRGWTLYVLGSVAVNLHEVGGAGVEALRRLVERASCWGISSQPPHHVKAETTVDLFRRTAADRTQASVGGTG
jgi:hypothetical protein